VQILHSFGFENLLPPPAGFENAPSPVPLNSAFAGGPPGTAAVETQSRPETPVTSTAVAAAAVATAAPAAGTSLSEMYATLNNSTVVEIDSAAARLATETSAVKYSGGEETRMIIADRAGTAAAASAAIESQNLIAPTVSLPATMSDLRNNAAGPANEINSQQLHAALHAVEAELLGVAALAREIASQMGRDLAIELAHLGTAAETSVIEQMTAPWDAWRFAALAGAAIATVAFIESESKREKPNAVFSSQLIEAVPTPEPR
jgi:hypothetical protein